jgi:perosamine synthetase
VNIRIPLSSPEIDEGDIAAVTGVLRSSRLSLGPVLEEFEGAFARYVGSAHAVALSSGTAGLHLALLALGVGAGDEVIVPSFTFIAAANAIRYVGATPVFVDIDPVTLNMDPGSVARAVTARTRGLMVVHTFGVPANLEALLEIAHRHGLKVIEDACEAVGAEYRGRKVGSCGDAGVFAFYPNKQMTSGEGGMVVTPDEGVAASMRSLRNQGRRPGDDWFEHSEIGYNYRISELNCALGLSQLKRIGSSLEMRKNVAAAYHRRLRDCRELVLPQLSADGCTVSWFVFVVRLNGGFDAAKRDRIRHFLNEAGIGCGRYFAPIHLQPAYRGAARAAGLPVTEEVAGRTLALPFFNRLTAGQIDEVCDCLLRALRRA